MQDFNSLIASVPPGRFDGIDRPYTAEDVMRLRGSFPIAHTVAERGARAAVAVAP